MFLFYVVLRPKIFKFCLVVIQNSYVRYVSYWNYVMVTSTRWAFQTTGKKAKTVCISGNGSSLSSCSLEGKASYSSAGWNNLCLHREDSAQPASVVGVSPHGWLSQTDVLWSLCVPFLFFHRRTSPLSTEYKILKIRDKPKNHWCASLGKPRNSHWLWNLERFLLWGIHQIKLLRHEFKPIENID